MQGHRPGNYSWKLVMIHITPSRCPSSLVRFSPSPKLGFFFFFFFFSLFSQNFLLSLIIENPLFSIFLGSLAFSFLGWVLVLWGVFPFWLLRKRGKLRELGFRMLGFGAGGPRRN